MEKYFELQDELKSLKLQGLNVEKSLEILQNIINELAIDQNN